MDELIEVLKGIQDALEKQNKLLEDIICYPIEPGAKPRILTSILDVVETTPVY